MMDHSLKVDFQLFAGMPGSSRSFDAISLATDRRRGILLPASQAIPGESVFHPCAQSR